MRRGALLPRVDEGRSLEEIQHGRVILQGKPVLDPRSDPLRVVVLQIAQFVVVRGVNEVLESQQIRPVRQRPGSVQIAVERLADIVFVFDIERLVGVHVPGGIHAAAAADDAEHAVHAFSEPDEVRFALRDLPAGSRPEFHRHERSYVAAEAVDDLRPLLQGLQLVVPKLRNVVIQVDDVRPVPHVVAGRAVRTLIEILRVFLPQDGIRGSMIIYDVDHALHAALLDLLRQNAEVFQRAVFRVHRPVIPDRVGAAQGALALQRADGMDGHEPENVCPQGFDAVQVRDQGAERALSRVVADVNGVDDLFL